MTKVKNNLNIFIIYIYSHPTISLLTLSFLSNLYLIYDYQLVNRSAIHMLWSLSNDEYYSGDFLSQILRTVSKFTSLSYINSGHLLMIALYSGISLILLRIVQLLGFSLTSQWAYIFLLLSQPNLNDFRSYIIIEPFFWFIWLLAIYFLLSYHRKSTVISISVWLLLFLLSSYFTIVSWFWLFLFPFGSLFWKPWRRRTVSYALLIYAIIIGALLFLPIYQGISPYLWLKNSIMSNPEPLFNALRIKDNNWVKEGDSFMSSIFVISGATSLILVRVLISLSFAPIALAIYSITKKQYEVIKYDYLRIIIYVIIFDIFISIILLLINADNSSVLSFSTVFLLLIFSSLGLSYIFKKIYLSRYSKLTSLIIVWCMIAYFTSGFIIFGARQSYIKISGEKFSTVKNNLYSNDSYFLFYAGKNPSSITTIKQAEIISKYKSFYYAYNKYRSVKLPTFWKKQNIIYKKSNGNGDKIIVFYVNRKNNKLK